MYLYEIILTPACFMVDSIVLKVFQPSLAWVLVGSCLATKVFIGNLPAMGRGWVII